MICSVGKELRVDNCNEKNYAVALKVFQKTQVLVCYFCFFRKKFGIINSRKEVFYERKKTCFKID